MASLLFAAIQIRAIIAAKWIAFVFAQTTAQRAKWNFKTERKNRKSSVTSTCARVHRALARPAL